jgi:alpha-galactosidase
VTYTKGLGTHANGDARLFLGGQCHTVTATVGVDDEVSAGGSVAFAVAGDGTLATPAVLTGSDHANWADATITCKP